MTNWILLRPKQKRLHWSALLGIILPDKLQERNLSPYPLKFGIDSVHGCPVFGALLQHWILASILVSRVPSYQVPRTYIPCACKYVPRQVNGPYRLCRTTDSSWLETSRIRM